MHRRDRGESTAQLVVLVPVVLLCLLVAVQAGLYFHSAHVAQAAAAQGAAAGAPRTAGAGDASTAAARTVGELGGRMAGGPVVAVGSSEAVVTVSVQVPRVVPFFASSVSRTAHEPRERFVPEEER